MPRVVGTPARVARRWVGPRCRCCRWMLVVGSRGLGERPTKGGAADGSVLHTWLMPSGAAPGPSAMR